MFKFVVLSCMLAVAAAGAITPLGWAGAGWGGWAGSNLAAPFAAPLTSPWAAPLAAPLASPWGLASPVVAQGAHLIRKRSAVLAASPVAWSNTAGLAVTGPLSAPLGIAPLAATPLAGAPLVGGWGAAPWGRVSTWGAGW